MGYEIGLDVEVGGGWMYVGYEVGLDVKVGRGWS